MNADRLDYSSRLPQGWEKEEHVSQMRLRLAGSSLRCTVLHSVALRWKGPLSGLGLSVSLLLGVFQERRGWSGWEAMP